MGRAHEWAGFRLLGGRWGRGPGVDTEGRGAEDRPGPEVLREGGDLTPGVVLGSFLVDVPWGACGHPHGDAWGTATYKDSKARMVVPEAQHQVAPVSGPLTLEARAGSPEEAKVTDQYRWGLARSPANLWEPGLEARREARWGHAHCLSFLPWFSGLGSWALVLRTVLLGLPPRGVRKQ